MPGENKSESAAGIATRPFCVYSKEELTRELRQGEIISSLAQASYDSSAEQVSIVIHPFAVVATQDCDLLWDYEGTREGKPSDLNGVLLYEAEPADQAKTKLPRGNDIWKRIIQNRDERYHLLESVRADDDCVGEGIPGLIIDFKRFFTLAASEIYRQITIAESARRRCRLEMPYREHFQTRAAFYFQRVMLPEPHKTPSAPKALSAPTSPEKK